LGLVVWAREGFRPWHRIERQPRVEPPARNKRRR
jgi:hypothetical protein